MENKKQVVVPKPKAELKADRDKIATQSREIAKALWSGKLTANEQAAINQICLLYGLDPILKQVVCLGGNIYMTGGALKVIGNKNPETAIDGIEVYPAVPEERKLYGCSNDDVKSIEYQHLFKATIWKKGCSHPFVEWGEADNGNVKLYNADFKSIADMAKTRAVNRALRNAYDIAFTSLEEMGYPAEMVVDTEGKVVEDGSPEKNKYKELLEKCEITKVEIGEEKYYETLGSFGFEHANQIRQIDILEKFLEECRITAREKKR